MANSLRLGEQTTVKSRVVARPRPSPVVVVMYVVLTVGAIIALVPFIWMILTSFKSQGEVAIGALFPRRVLLSNYVDAWRAAPFAQYYFNTIFVATCTVLGVVTTSSLAAYAFARMEFAGRNIIFTAFLATMMIPGEVTLIPNFLTIRSLHLIDTYWAMIFPFTASAFYIFLLRQFFLTIPRDLYDAAVLDGAGHLRFLTRIVLPLSRAALVTVALFAFIGSWNALLWPLIVINSAKMKPIAFGLISFVVDAGPNTQLQMAAATISIVPILVLYFFTQKQFTEGIATTGLKG